MKQQFKSLLVLLLALLFLMPTGALLRAEESEEVEAEADFISTEGPDDGIHLEMWTFVELHSQFYAEMLHQWNEENPDKQLQITFTTYPFSDMHTKLTLANQSGEGAPDLCDIEINQFPNYMQGDVQFIALNDYFAPYQDDIVQARIDAYSRDGEFYGVPTHVGATVMYYNVTLLEEAGVDYTEIETWDDFAEAGEKVKESTNGESFMTTVDTSGTDWLWLSMAEHGEDWTDDEGVPNVNIPSVKSMLEMQQSWIDAGIAKTTPGGQIDTEEGFAAIADNEVAAFPKALWYMSRFLNYIPEMEGQWAIAPAPVYEVGQPRSVGIGGTGTVVSSQSENAELAAEFISFAKLSYEGNVKIWDVLGFDPCNTSIWYDEDITRDEDNKYIQYFVTNPFDTLVEIQEEIGNVKVVKISPMINEIMNTSLLNNVLESGADVDAELESAQDTILFEAY